VCVHLQYKVSDKLTTMSAVVSVRWTGLLCYWLHPITPVVGALHGDTDNICDNLSPYFYHAVMPQCPSVCPSVTFRSPGAVITLDGILRKYFHRRMVMRL